MLLKILSSNSMIKGRMYHIEDLVINTEGLMRPKAQKQYCQCLTSAEGFSRERTISHIVFYSTSSSGEDLHPDRKS